MIEVDILFLRHGAALPDGERPLSRDGHKQVAKVARALRKIGVQIDAIYTSPLARAQQTAQILADEFGMQASVTDSLDSGATLDDVRGLLEDHNPGDCVALVGHEPDFSTMVGLLIGGGAVDVKKAGVALVACRQIAVGGGVLEWLAPAKKVRA